MDREKKKSKSELILNTAFDLFMKNGYVASKIIDIAERAGIGKGTVYEYFASKEEILLRLVEDRVMAEFGALRANVEASTDIRSGLKAYMDFTVAFMKKYGSYLEEIKGVVSEGDGNETIEKVKKLVVTMMEIESRTVEDLLRRGMEKGEVRECNVPLTAQYIVATVLAYASVRSGMLRNMKIADMGISTEAYDRLAACNEDELFDLILHGIGA